MNPMRLLRLHALLPLVLLGPLAAQAEVPPKPKPQPTSQPAKVEGPASRPAPDKQPPKPAEEQGAGDKREQPLPASADPADLRAMKSAQDMLAAEARLREKIKRGEIQGIEKVLSFEEISTWPYEDGLKGMPKNVKALDGKSVMMMGFMLPIDEVENIKHFLLVQSLWSCCYGTPPDINGIVRVVLKGNKRIDYMFEPIQVVGTFRVSATLEDGYCVDIFQLHADSVTVVK